MLSREILEERKFGEVRFWWRNNIIDSNEETYKAYSQLIPAFGAKPQNQLALSHAKRKALLKTMQVIL